MKETNLKKSISNNFLLFLNFLENLLIFWKISWKISGKISEKILRTVSDNFWDISVVFANNCSAYGTEIDTFQTFPVGI